MILFVETLSNGHSPANLSNSSTRQKFAIFGEFEYSPKWSFWKIGRTRYIRRHLPTCFGRTRYICRHSPTYFARTPSSVSSLSSLANFASFGELYIIYQVGQIKRKLSGSKNCNKTFCQASKSN